MAIVTLAPGMMLATDWVKTLGRSWSSRAATLPCARAAEPVDGGDRGREHLGRQVLRVLAAAAAHRQVGEHRLHGTLLQAVPRLRVAPLQCAHPATLVRFVARLDHGNLISA